MPSFRRAEAPRGQRGSNLTQRVRPRGSVLTPDVARDAACKGLPRPLIERDHRDDASISVDDWTVAFFWYEQPECRGNQLAYVLECARTRSA